MSDPARTFIRSAATLAFASVAMRAASVVFGAAVSRRVGAETTGLFALVGSVTGFAVTLAVSGIHLAVTRTVSEAIGKGEDAAAVRAVRHALLYALFFGCAAAVLLFAAAPLIGARALRDARAVRPLRLFALSLLPIALATVWQGYYTATRRVARLAAGQAAEQGLRMGLTWWFVRGTVALGAERACLALVGGGVAADLFSCLYLSLHYLFDRYRKTGGFDKKPSVSVFRRLFAIAIPVALSAYVRSALLAVEHALIPGAIVRSGRTRRRALSDYGELQGMALPVVLFSGALLYPVAGLLIPEFSERSVRGDVSSVRRLCGRVYEATLVFSILCTLLLASHGRALGRLLYGSDTVGRYILFLSFVLPVMFCDHVTDCMLKGLGEEVWCMWVNILDAAGSIFLVLLLLPRLGAAGYVAVIIIAEVANFSLSFWRLERRSGYSPRFLSHLVRPALCAAAAYGALSALFPSAPDGAPLAVVLRMSVLGLLYLALVALTRPRRRPASRKAPACP